VIADSDIAPAVQPASDRGRRRNTAALMALNLALLGILLYTPSLQSPFVYDDLVEIVRNASIRDLSHPVDVLRAYPTRPLTNLSYALDFAWGGLNPLWYHATNLLLHGINILLVFYFVRAVATRVGGASTPASPAPLVIPLVVASLFAIHPVQTEAVTYISGRAEVLATTLILGTMLCFVRAFEMSGGRRTEWTVVGSATVLCAIAAKEVAVALPAVVLAYDWIVVGPDNGARRRLWRVHVPLLALVLVLGSFRLWRYVSLEMIQSSDLQWRNAFLELHVLQRYVGLLLVPKSLSLVPAVAPLPSLLDLRVAGGVATLAICLGLAALMRRRQPLATFGIVWFLIALVPSAALVVLQDAGHPMAEHRLYLPSVGFFLAFATIAERMRVQSRFGSGSTRAAIIAGVAVMAILAAATLARERVWADPVSLWKDAASKAPNAFTAQYGLAEAYRVSADCDNAISAYRRAKQIRPSAPAPYIGHAWCLLERGESKQAREQLELAVARAPRDVKAHVALAVIEATVFRDSARAADLCRSAMAFAPADPEASDCFRRSVDKVTP